MEEMALLVEDDKVFGEALKVFLEDNGLPVIWAEDGETAIRLYKELNPHLILLDIILPGKNGFEVATAIRKLNSVVPIIFMTGTAMDRENYDKAYLQLGASNYIEKPVNPHNALAQIRSLLYPIRTIKKYNINNYRITIGGQQLIINNREFQLRDKEAQILSLLLDNPNLTVTRRDILHKVWKDDKSTMNSALHTAISHIRKELKKFPDIKIKTFHAMGYQLIIKSV